MLHTLRRALEKSGAQVVVATTTETALRNIAMTKPSMIVTDISMPDGSGYDLVKRLRSDPATAHTPVIALTAPRAAGFDAHAAKPTRALKLIRAIEETFARMFREPMAALRAHTRIATYR